MSPMPKMAVTHIQNTAPGPPMAMATPTPAMFPVPMVADRAALRAWKWVISPLSSGLSNFPEMISQAYPNLRICTARNSMAMRMPVPTRSTMVTGPHTNPLMLLKIWSIGIHSPSSRGDHFLLMRSISAVKGQDPRKNTVGMPLYFNLVIPKNPVIVFLPPFEKGGWGGFLPGGAKSP